MFSMPIRWNCQQCGLSIPDQGGCMVYGWKACPRCQGGPVVMAPPRVLDFVDPTRMTRSLYWRVRGKLAESQTKKPPK